MQSTHTHANDDGASHITGHDVPGGCAACAQAASAKEAAREARHEARLKNLDILCNIGMEIAAGLGHASARRHEFDTSAFARVADPATSYTRVALAIRRIMALSHWLDEDATARKARIAEEKAAQERKAARESLNGEKRIARRAVREAFREANPDLDRDRRENLLDDLFRDYDDYNHGTLAQVIAAICTDLGVVPDMTLWEHAPKEGEAPDPVKLKVLTLEMAEEYLAEAMQTAPPPAAQPAAAAPVATPANERGRGPPG